MALITEMGDRTQLATMLFASEKEVSKWMIFLGASLALIATSGIGMLADSALSNYARACFVIIGFWIL